MNPNRPRPIFSALLFFLGAAVPLWAGPMTPPTPTLSLLPSGDISGPAGANIGWGFTITNNLDYIEITSAEFCLTPFPACSAPTIGMFTDIISQFGNDVIVGPPGAMDDPSTVSEPYEFDMMAKTGVGNFAINPGALPGDTNSGQIVLTYNVFDQDPNNGGMELFDDQVLTANASVTVTAATTPEPATAGLLVLGMAALVLVRRLAAAR